jgi:CheY-like chemotaxis protein
MSHPRTSEPAAEILVADDHEDTREILRAYFTAHGFRVREAKNGEEALAELEKACPDAVVLDIRMPKVDGLTVLRTVRANCGLRHVPILALSAHALPEEVREIAEAGTDAYLAKPAEPRAVLQAVHSLLAERSARSAGGP